MAKKDTPPKFEDTEPIHEHEAPAFDDTAELSPEEQQSVVNYISKPEVSKLESARAGFASGGTMGFAPRIGAAGGALASSAQQSLSGEPNKQSLKDLYNEYLKYNQQRENAAQAANPLTFGATQFAGGMVSPLNKIGAPIVKLGKDAPMIAKMASGMGAGARIGAVGGLSQSPDLTNLPADIKAAGTGAGIGMAMGAGLPPVGAGLKGLAGGTANMIRPLIGRPGTMFGKGMQAGVEGAPNLAGEPGQLQATQARGAFADQFVTDLNAALTSNAKNKRELITNALVKSQLTPKEAVDAVTQKYLQANPQLNEESARKELAHLKEMILTAVEGPKKTEVVRVHNQPPPPVSATPNTPLGQVERGLMVPPGEVPPMAPPQGAPPQLGPGQPPPGAMVPSPGGITGEAAQMAPTPQATPPGFAGYEKIHAQTIDAGDEKAIEAFEHKVNEKLAEEKSLGKNVNDNDVEIEHVPIEGSDKIRLVAKRAKIEENPNEFKEQAANLNQQQKEAQRLQDMLDRQNEEKLKMQQQQEAELMKPQYTDETRTVREGGRNLQNPEELYALQKNLQAKSQFSEGRGFSSQEMNKMSGEAAKDIAQLIKMTIPETVPVDERLNAFNNIAESLGINTDKLQLPGGEGQKARQDAMSKILGVLKPEAISDKGQVTEKGINYVQEQLSRVHPDIGEAFSKEAAKHAEQAATMNELMKPHTVGGGGPVLSSIRRGLNKTAYNVGYGAGSEIKKMTPGVEAAKKLFQNYTPDALQKAGSAAAQSGNAAVQKLGQVLTKLSTADERTRNSMMFVLEQQDGYRQLMAPYFEDTEPHTPQAKDKTLEKYK